MKDYFGETGSTVIGLVLWSRDPFRVSRIAETVEQHLVSDPRERQFDGRLAKAQV